jgi:hypothetical protein
MGCVPCNQVTERKKPTPSEDNKTNNPQNPNFNDLTDAASTQLKNPFHDDKKYAIINVENDNENINADKTSVGESHNQNIINNVQQANIADKGGKNKNIYDSNENREEDCIGNKKNIESVKFNNAYEIQNQINSELVQSSNGTLVIGSKTNIFGINKNKNYYYKSNNYINNFKGKNSINQNENEDLFIINE